MTAVSHHQQPPFGHFGLAPWREALRSQSGAWRKRLPVMSSALRKACLAGLDDPFDIELDANFRLRLYPRDNLTDKHTFVGLGAYADAIFESALDEAIKAASKRFAFVDVGGNTGIYTIAAARAARNAGLEFQAVIIEANPDMAARLRFNLAASGIEATIVEAAVSDAETPLHLDIGKSNLGEASIGAAGASTIEVQARTLPAILDKAGFDAIDLLKIDIEGHEVPALSPLMAGRKQRHPRHIIAEVRHDPEEGIASLLAASGYGEVWRKRADALFSRAQNDGDRRDNGES